MDKDKLLADQLLAFVQQKLAALKLEMDAQLNGPEAEYQYLCGRYEAYEEMLAHCKQIASIVDKQTVKYKYKCPECETEIIGDTPDAHYACGNCSCQPWDNGGQDIEMVYVGVVAEWNEE